MTTPALDQTLHAKLEQLLSRLDPRRDLVRKSETLGHGVGQFSLELAELLVRRNQAGDCEQAVRIIEQVLDAQVGEGDDDCGRFPMLLPETWRDLNGTMFLLPSLVALAGELAGRLPGTLVGRLQQSVRRAAVAVERRWADEVFDVHRDFTAYSNIFAMYVHCLVLLANHLDDARLRNSAQGQWRRWFNHIAYYGIDEFVSPNYNFVIFKAVRGIAAAAVSEDMRSEARRVLDHIVALQSAVHHPVLGLPISGVSRDYRLFVEPGKGAFPPFGTGEAEAFTNPQVSQEVAQRHYPHRTRGRAGTTPFFFDSWQTQNSGLGSMTGGQYFPQHLHLMAAVGTSPLQRAIAFFNADPSNAINGFVHQMDNRALCLFARTTNRLLHSQLRLHPATLPSVKSKPAALGLVGDWTINANDDGTIQLHAHDHHLHLHTFAIDHGRMHDCRWANESLELNGQSVRVLRAEERWTYVGCVVDLRGPGDIQQVERPEITVDFKNYRLALHASGGLHLNLTMLRSGEWIENYDHDWRTQPLLTSPAAELWPGDFTKATSRPI